MSKLSPEDEQDIEDTLARRTLPYMREASAQYRTMYFNAIGMSQFDLDNLTSGKRARLYAQYPPVLPNMTIPGPAADGRMDWLTVSQVNPEYHAQKSEDMAKLAKARLRQALLTEAGF